MTKITHILIVLLTLVALVSSITEKKQQQPKTIVEANRYYSIQDKIAYYNITGVTPNKPLILLLNSKTNLQKLIKEGLVLTFSGQNQNVKCPFKAVTDLCVVPVTPKDLVLTIQCKNLPCEVQWIIYQIQPRDLTSNMPALNLYSLQKTTHHVIGEIACNDPKIQTLDEDVVVYSQTPYSRAYYNNVIYLFFNSFQYGNVYIDVAEASRACAFINFTNVNQEIKINENAVKDFAQKGADTVFQIKNVPTTDFAVECSAIRLDKFSTLKSSIRLNLIGWKKDKSHQIVSHQIKAIARSQANDFSFVFKAPPSGFDKLTLQFIVDNAQLYLLDFNVISGDFFIVDLGVTTYFTLKKGEKIILKVQGDEDINDIEKYYLIQKRKADLNLNTHQCDPKIGCSIQIEALNDTDNMLYLSSKNQESTHLDQNGKGLFEFQQIQFITINQKVKRKIRLGDSVFLKKQIKKGKSYNIHINSPNVLVYAASKSKCEVPSSKCRERTSNYHHPFIYEATEDNQLLINVEGLQNTEFQLTIVEDNSLIQITDGTPFSYSMDEEQQRIDFSFKLQNKSDVTFNLISPLNALKLYVSNTVNKEKDLQNIEQSTDGFIEFKKNDIEELYFTVSVVKTSKDKYFSHFILVASTKESKQRLESSVTNYETISVKNHKDFIFEFDKNEDYNLGISVFNLKTKNVDLQVRLSQDEKWSDAQPIKINKEVDFIDIKTISQALCLKQGELSCQLFVRIYNKMPIEVDFTITLYSRNAIIELKDGIWQSFPADLVMATSSFYFYPRHNRSDLLLLFHSPSTRTRVSSRLFKYDSEHINPTQWPFPVLTDSHSAQTLPYRTNHYISISKNELNSKCWPNCVLLVNFYIQQFTLVPMSTYDYSYFKLMVSNNQLELPQNQKVSFSLGKSQDRQILIDLKYILDKQYIMFYTASTIGDCSISANVYSEKHQICPILNEDPDFTINWGEHTLYIDDIKSSLKDKGMSEDKNVYLCAAIHSESSCKFSIQYNTQNDGFKEITIDSYEDIKLKANETRFFKVSGKIESNSKITRISGFPFIKLKKCDASESLQKCKEDFRQEPGKGRQIVAKTESMKGQSCINCEMLFKISAEEPVQLNFHSQSKASEMQLKQKITLSDFLNQFQTNKYQAHVRNGQDLNVNIHVQEGDVEVHLTDYNNINLMKKSSKEQRVIQFNIKDNKDKHIQEQHADGMKAGANNFIVYHLSVLSIDENKAASYTIGYSSGASQFFLQDGLIVDYQLAPKIPHSFFYCNERTKEPVIYTLATESAQSLKQLKIKAFTFQQIGEEDSKQEIQLGKPNQDKKSPGPTIVYNLPTSVCFEIQLSNPTSKPIKASMGINHQEVLFLPFNHEYPFQLHKNEYLNILADVNIPGFIELHIKKCDQSSPSFSYTFDYDSFVKGQYMYKGVLDELSTTVSIKAQRIGTLFITFESGDEDSLITTKINYSQQKKKSHVNLPGRHGQLLYQFLDNAKLNITLGAVECSSCKVKKYTAVSSQVQEDLYQQLICPNTFFGTKAKAPIKTEPISTHKAQKQISFIFDIAKGVQYVGVVAELETGQQIYYRPIEIATLWGRLSQNTSNSFKIWMALIGTMLLFCCLVCWRRVSRQGYRPLNEGLD